MVNACTVNQIQDKESWYVDNGATTHIAVSRKMFTDFREFDSNHTVTTADGTVIPAVGIGSIKVESKVNETKVHITLEEVWLVPSLTKNLFSPLAAQDRAQNSIFTSTTKKCKLEIEGMTKVDGRRIPKGGLYKLDFKTDATDTTEQDDDGEFVDAEGEENFPAEGEQQPLDIVEPLRVEVPRLEGEEEEIVVEPLRDEPQREEEPRYNLRDRTKTTTTVSTPSTKKSYTVFQVVGNPKIEGVPDSPYFSDDHAFNHKARVKKNLPDYVWSAVRVKRDTEEKIKTTTDNKAKVEQKSTTLPTITNSGKVESPTMRSIQEKNTDAKEANGGTTITNEAKTERKAEKVKETYTKEAVTKAQKKTHSKASKKNVEKVVVDIKTANNTNILRKLKSKVKSTDAKKERSNRNTKSKGAVSKKNKKQKKRKVSGKNTKKSKARSKSKVKKNEKSKSANATRTTAKIPKAQRRLISAREALIEDYPYMVSIQKDGQHWCSGALLNPRLVITTANCLWKANRISRMQVRAGSRYIDRGGQLVSIQEVMKHPAWGLRKSPDNDVALLLLDKNIRLYLSWCGTERYPSMFSYLASHSNLDFIANATRFLMADKRHYPFVDRFPVLNH
ncbi:hypothetical protein HF086_005808 [Spodoptera exigua]|uniref:Peptidase S1 domain-containing protein n=1 Tax=Spodoptera exigua TaxID=7107 RepID=A0A922SBV0_SPOEX|nr:hypothetical protein HF086_005808 [Spodoptera exigua]